MWVWSYLWHWVVVDVDDPVEVSSDDLCDLKQTLEVILAIDDKAIESDRGQVADCHLIWSGVLHNLCAQVAGLDGAEVLRGRGGGIGWTALSM